MSILDAVTKRGGYVVHDLDPALPLRASKAEHAWDRLRKRAGITNARLHDLRHTAGTLAGGTGANAFVVRDLLGHLTLAMTGRYVHPAGVWATADKVSKHVAAALNAGTAPPAEIVELTGGE